jgi:hypothetical protein
MPFKHFSHCPQNVHLSFLDEAIVPKKQSSHCNMNIEEKLLTMLHQTLEA